MMSHVHPFVLPLSLHVLKKLTTKKLVIIFNADDTSIGKIIFFLSCVGTYGMSKCVYWFILCFKVNRKLVSKLLEQLGDGNVGTRCPLHILGSIFSSSLISNS